MRYRALLGTLVARTPVHVGSGLDNDVSDDLCRRTAAGEFFIPGTAIGGVLRAIATRLAPRLGSPICRALETGGSGDPCGCWTCHLFGDINPGEGGAGAHQAAASRLVIAPARASLKGNTARIRDGVGIDRSARVAARTGQVKFNLEVLPAETEFDLRLELDETQDFDENDERLLAAVLAEWRDGRLWIGGRRARGLGAFDLANGKLVELNLSTAEGIMKYLQVPSPWEIATEIPDWLNQKVTEARAGLHGGKACHDGVARSFVMAQLDLRLDSLFVTKDEVAAVRGGFDQAPLLDIIGRDGRPVLPGASLRGALRAQAERIARTIATIDAAGKDDFLRSCPACNPVDSDQDEALASCDIRIQKKADIPDEREVSDNQLCLSCRLFGSTRRGTRLIIEDAVAEGEVQRKVLDFLAIDRFTGGARQQAKFDAFALWRPLFKVRLYLENPDAWELGWLALVLRDLRDGMVPLGFGAAKGFGRASVASWSLQYGFIGDDDFAGPVELAATSQWASSLYRLLEWDSAGGARQDSLRGLVENWLKEFWDTLKTLRHELGLSPSKDTFFDGDLPSLYEKDAYQCLLKEKTPPKRPK